MATKTFDITIEALPFGESTSEEVTAFLADTDFELTVAGDLTIMNRRGATPSNTRADRAFLRDTDYLVKRNGRFEGRYTAERFDLTFGAAALVNA